MATWGTRILAALGTALRRVREAARRWSVPRGAGRDEQELGSPQSPVPEEFRDAPPHWLALIRSRAPEYLSGQTARTTPMPNGRAHAPPNAPAPVAPAAGVPWPQPLPPVLRFPSAGAPAPARIARAPQAAPAREALQELRDSSAAPSNGPLPVVALPPAKAAPRAPALGTSLNGRGKGHEPVIPAPPEPAGDPHRATTRGPVTPCLATPIAPPVPSLLSLRSPAPHPSPVPLRERVSASVPERAPAAFSMGAARSALARFDSSDVPAPIVASTGPRDLREIPPRSPKVMPPRNAEEEARGMHVLPSGASAPADTDATLGEHAPDDRWPVLPRRREVSAPTITSVLQQHNRERLLALEQAGHRWNG